MKTQRTAFLKKAALFFLIPALILSYPTAAYADDCNPECYVMSMVLRCLGVATYNEVGQWVAAYEGYLESTGNQALLTQLKGYRSTSWGSTVKGINPLYQSVREWLFKASVYGPDNNGNYIYTLPSKSAPLPSSAFGVRGVQGTRFTDVNVPSDVSGYTYCFSQVFESTSTSNGVTRNTYNRRDVYAPSGSEVFGICENGNGYSDNTFIRFYIPDPSSSTGYKNASLRAIRTGYYSDNHSLCYKNTKLDPSSWDWTWESYGSVMNFPIKIFISAYYAEKYCKTGVAQGLFGKNTASLWSRGEGLGTDLSLKDRDVSFVGDTLTLPLNASEAHQLCGSNFGKTLEGLSSEMERLNKFTIHYQADYTIKHYKQGIAGKDGNREWELEETETLTGTAGETVHFTPKEYAGFTYSPGFTSPEDLTITGDGDLSVSVYYTRNPVSYQVEHYKQSTAGEDGSQGWEKAQSETLTGLFGESAAFTPATYPGFTYSPGLTSPKELTLPDEEGFTVKLYYTRDPVLYRVEHCFQETADAGGNRGWGIHAAEVLSGTAGKDAIFTPKDSPGFTYQSDLTSPQDVKIPETEGLVIKLYYTRNRYAYQVEHYLQENPGGEAASWKRQVSEEYFGYFGEPVLFGENPYPGYAFAADLTDLGGGIVSADGNVTVRLYYRQVTAMEVALDTASQSFKKTVSSAEQSVMPLLKGYIPLVAFILFLFLAWVIYRNLFYRLTSTKKEKDHKNHHQTSTSQGNPSPRKEQEGQGNKPGGILHRRAAMEEVKDGRKKAPEQEAKTPDRQKGFRKTGYTGDPGTLKNTYTYYGDWQTIPEEERKKQAENQKPEGSRQDGSQKIPSQQSDKQKNPHQDMGWNADLMLEGAGLDELERYAGPTEEDYYEHLAYLEEQFMDPVINPDDHLDY